MILVVFFFLCFLAFAFVMWLPYRIVRDSQPSSRFAIRTWAVFFFLQMIYVTIIPRDSRYYPFYLVHRNGYRLLRDILFDFKWVFGQIIHGKGNDYLLIVVLPLIPTLAAFLVGYLLERNYNSNKSN